jgi:hypothetical protein
MVSLVGDAVRGAVETRSACYCDGVGWDCSWSEGD